MVKKIGLILLLITFFNFLHAGVLDDVTKELDEIEREFWTITTLDRMSERHREFSQKLALFTISCRDIQAKLQKTKQRFQLPNITDSSVAIEDILKDIRTKDILAYGILAYPRYTSVKYFLGASQPAINNFSNHRYNSRNSNRFNRSNRYTNNNQSDNKSNSTSNAKIDLNSYQRWLYNIKQANENDFLNSSKRILQRGTRKHKKNSRVRSIIDYYNLYMTNIVNLRLTIETLRQKAKNLD